MPFFRNFPQFSQVAQDALQTAYLAGLKDGILVASIAAIILYLLFVQKD